MYTKTKGQHFYILDYFLDGYFLKSEAIHGNCPVCGESLVVNLDNGTEVVTHVLDTEPISEDERKIFLTSV